MKKGLMILAVMFLAGWAQAVQVVQTTPTMVAIPSPVAGLQVYVQTPGVYYYYNGTNYVQYSVYPSNSVIHFTSGTSPATPAAVQVIPAPSPGITEKILSGQVNNIGSSATPTAFHMGNSATPTAGGTVFGQATYPSGLAANIVGPYPVNTPAAPVSFYIDSGVGQIQWFLTWTQSDGQ
jgi:hypothetical protein